MLIRHTTTANKREREMGGTAKDKTEKKSCGWDNVPVRFARHKRKRLVLRHMLPCDLLEGYCGER